MSIGWARITRDEYHRLYWEANLTDEEIGLMFGVSKDTAAGKRKRLGIPGRGYNRAPGPLRDTGRRLRTTAPFLR